MFAFGPALRRPFCRHKDTLTKIDHTNHRAYTECVRCLYQSPGVIFTPSRRVSTTALNHTLTVEARNGHR